MFLQAPSTEERQQLLQEIGPLPLKGMAWPKWIKLLACGVLVFIAVQIVQTASGPSAQNISPVVAGSIIVCFMGLVVLARYMLVSETCINETGIQQSWISKREVAWEDIQFAKFIPLVASKRLVCFTGRGRPVIFQAGTRELQIAFARIALVYRRKK
ncbi:hypothetical protein CKA81_15765 [Pollutimonas thiosulfatoxidans]|uniref:Uncharacterized protein n=2 Tax=Pollutimonas thiosulfatoxidans TaxID=2028345 RepID=A0A410GFX6_9BURK|nr:hypothetical protein [Pollutimonas thiosulfatoxidans]QAA95155.1 hypothetical protein CKA81_15765 [Pollutimonas thiosulfatoxidans]